MEEPTPTQFKARELNKRILHAQDKLPDIPRKDLTQFESFKLSESNKTPVATSESVTPSKFKAAPLNPKILQ